MDLLERFIHSRLYSTLAPREAAQLEDRVRDQALAGRQKLRYLDEAEKASLEARLANLLQSYDTALDKVKKEESKHDDLHEKVSQLQRLSPRQFEEYVAELFAALEYENVTLTPLN